MDLIPAGHSEAKFKLTNILLRDVEDVRDKSIVIENGIGLEYIFTLIANGVNVHTICARLGVTEQEFSAITKSSPLLRKRYMQAKAFLLADRSMDTLLAEEFGECVSMDREMKNAADFHNQNIDRVIKSTGEELNKGSTIIHNTVVVRGHDEVPSLPDELEDVLNAEFCEVEG